MKAEIPHIAAPRASSRIAICGWSLQPHNPTELLERLKLLQVHSAQVPLSQIVNESAEWENAVEVLRDGGIWVISGMMSLQGGSRRGIESVGGSGVLADEAWFANRSHAEKVARSADRECIPLVTTHIGTIPADPSGPQWAKLADRVGALAEIFAHYGVTLAIETGQAPPELLDQIINELNIPSLAVNFDPATIVLERTGDPIVALRRLAPRIRQAHVRDATLPRNETGGGREVPVGRGVVDWNAFFEVATAIVPPIQFVIERDPRLMKDEDITTARDLIAYHLGPPNGLRR